MQKFVLDPSVGISISSDIFVADVMQTTLAGRSLYLGQKQTDKR